MQSGISNQVNTHTTWTRHTSQLKQGEKWRKVNSENKYGVGFNQSGRETTGQTFLKLYFKKKIFKDAHQHFC